MKPLSGSAMALLLAAGLSSLAIPKEAKPQPPAREPKPGDYPKFTTSEMAELDALGPKQRKRRIAELKEEHYRRKHGR